MDKALKPDLCVIGAGAGGLTAASLAAQLGASVVLIEKHKMGGDCLNYGCVPSKSLLAAARRAQNMRDAGQFGIAAADPVIDHRLVHGHVHGVIASIAPNESVERFQGLGVKVIPGTAKFKDHTTVVVDGQEIMARRFIIATGSSPAIPPIPGIESVPYLTNESIFDINYLMPHLIIVGGGPLGLELGQAYRRLGSEVTVLEALTPLGNDDPELTAPVLQRLQREGVRILDEARIERIEPFGQNIQVVFTKDGRSYSIDGTHLLIAAGRKPNLDGLNLDAAGVKFNRTGISVDDSLKTSNKRIYAIGDVTGKLPYTHVAAYHATLAVRNFLFRWPVIARHEGLPHVTFTQPELAQTGLTEAAAREQKLDIRVLRWPYHENDRAHTEHATEGYLKVITTKRGRILGAGVVGEQAGEVIQLWSLAMQQGISIRAMASYVAAYPTFTEVNKRAAISYFMPKLTSPLIGRVIGWLAKFG